MAYIHINRNKIASNHKHGLNEPCIAVKDKRSGSARYAYRVDILDKDGDIVASIVQNFRKPLSCGAVVYVETQAKLALHFQDNEDAASNRQQTAC